MSSGFVISLLFIASLRVFSSRDNVVLEPISGGLIEVTV